MDPRPYPELRKRRRPVANGDSDFAKSQQFLHEKFEKQQGRTMSVAVSMIPILSIFREFVRIFLVCFTSNMLQDNYLHCESEISELSKGGKLRLEHLQKEMCRVASLTGGHAAAEWFANSDAEWVAVDGVDSFYKSWEQLWVQAMEDGIAKLLETLSGLENMVSVCASRQAGTQSQ